VDLKKFDTMEADDLRSYIEFLMWHYRVMDSFWFIYTAEAFGQERAVRINEKVWGQVPGMAAKDLVTRFNIQEKGLQRFVEALRYYPWMMLIGFQIETFPDEVILQVPIVQESRDGI